MIDPAATGASSEVWRELLAGEDRGDVHLDDGNRHGRHGVAQRHRSMRIPAGIEHHAVVNAVGLLHGVDQFAFDVRLEVAELHRGIVRFQRFEIRLESLRSVNPGVAPPLKIEVRSVENQYLHSFIH